MSTADDRVALADWVRATLKQLDETCGEVPWTDASNNDEGRRDT